MMPIIIIASILVLTFFYYSVQRRKVKLHNRKIDNQERFEQLIEHVKKDSAEDKQV